MRAGPLSSSPPPRLLSPPRALASSPPGARPAAAANARANATTVADSFSTRTAFFTWPRLILFNFCATLASLALAASVPSAPWLLYASQNSPKRFTWRWQGCYDFDTGVGATTVAGCDPLLPSQLLYAALAFDAAALAGTLLLLGAAWAEGRPRRSAVVRLALDALRRAGPPLSRGVAASRALHLTLLIAALAKRDEATPPNAWSERLEGYSCLAAAVACSAASLVGWAALGTAELWRRAMFVDVIGAEAARVRSVLSSARRPPSLARAVGGYAVGGAAARLVKELPAKGALRGVSAAV